MLKSICTRPVLSAPCTPSSMSAPPPSIYIATCLSSPLPALRANLANGSRLNVPGEGSDEKCRRHRLKPSRKHEREPAFQCSRPCYMGRRHPSSQRTPCECMFALEMTLWGLFIVHARIPQAHTAHQPMDAAGRGNGALPATADRHQRLFQHRSTAVGGVYGVPGPLLASLDVPARGLLQPSARSAATTCA